MEKEESRADGTGDAYLCLWASWPLGFSLRKQRSGLWSLTVAPWDTLFPSVTASRAIFSTGPLSFPRAAKTFQGLDKRVGYVMQKKAFI